MTQEIANRNFFIFLSLPVTYLIQYDCHGKMIVSGPVLAVLNLITSLNIASMVKG